MGTTRKFLIVLLVTSAVLSGIYIIYNSFFTNDKINYTCNDILRSCNEIKGEPLEINPDNYSLKEIEEIIDCNTIFPDKIPTDNKYFLFKEKCGSDRGYIYRSEIYLECNYNEEDYNYEFQRLNSIEKNGLAIYSSDLFVLPSIITAYNDSGLFEYCLFDEDEFKIYYIHLFAIDSIDNVVFDKSFAPKKELKDSDFPINKIKNGHYTIY